MVKKLAENAGFLECYRQMSDICNEFLFAIRYHSLCGLEIAVLNFEREFV